MVSQGAVSFFSNDIDSVLRPKWEAEYVAPVPVYVPEPPRPEPVVVPDPVIPDTVVDVDVLAKTVIIPDTAPPDVEDTEPDVPDTVPDVPVVIDEPSVPDEQPVVPDDPPEPKNTVEQQDSIGILPDEP